MNELEKSRIEKAIHNIFKEAGHNVIKIDNENILVDIHGEQRIYKYKIKAEEDTITIFNKKGIIITEHFISSYQEPFSFVINK